MEFTDRTETHNIIVGKCCRIWHLQGEPTPTPYFLGHYDSLRETQSSRKKIRFSGSTHRKSPIGRPEEGVVFCRDR